MQGIHIVATGRAIPEKKVTNDDLSKIMDTSDEWIRTRTGISSRHYCEGETCSSLAIAAAGKAMERAGILPEEIGVVIVATSSAEYVLPSMACLVQRALKMSTDTMSFDLSAACSGFLYGLNVCRGLLQNSPKKYALLIGSEQLSRLLDFNDRASCILFGDGAGAVILTLDDSQFFHRAWSEGNMEALSCRGVGFENAKVVMDGKAVFRFAVKVVKQGIDAVLTDAGMNMEDIDYVICHQANERIIDSVSHKFPGNEKKFYKNIAGYGNTSAASIPIALDEMGEKGILKSGMKLLLVGFGAGMTWSSALLTV